MTKKPDRLNVRLEELVKRSNRVLFVVRAVFPIELVPDQITIDETKVTFEYRNVLNSNDIQTILIQDIFEAEITHTFFLASICVKTDRRTYTISFLPIKEAMKAKELITGLQIACRENIDLTKLDLANLTERLVEIGKSHATP